MLHQGASLPALGAADNLRRANKKIARGKVLKAKQTGEGRLSPGCLRHCRHSKLVQSSGDKPMHSAEPRFSRLPRRSSRQCQAVGQLVMVDQRRTARRPANERQAGRARVAASDTTGGPARRSSTTVATGSIRAGRSMVRELSAERSTLEGVER